MMAIFSRGFGDKEIAITDKANNSLLPVLITALLFYVAGKLTLPLSFPPSYATAIWPPAGIGLAATLLWGYRVLPGIFIAELLIHYEVYDVLILLTSPAKLLVFFLNPFNSVVRSWLGCFLVKKLAAYPNELISTRPIVLFFLLAGPIATLLPAAFSVFGLWYNQVIVQEDLVFAFLTWWLGDCTGIAIFTPLFFIIFGRPNGVWRQRAITVGLPLVLMFLLTAFTYLYAQQQEMKRLKKIVEYQAHHIKDHLENRFSRQLALINLYQSLVGDSKITAQNFRTVSLSIIGQLPDISRLVWLEPDRKDFGSRLIKRYSAEGPLDRDFDVKTLLEKANRLDFSQGESVVADKRELLIMAPVFDKGEHRCNCLKGVVAGMFDPHRFVQDILANKNLKHVIIQWFNGQDKENGPAIFQSQAGSELIDFPALNYRQMMRLGRSEWLLNVKPDHKFLAENYSWLVWQLLAGGMFLTGLTSISLLMLTGHTELVKSKVAQRTQELKLSNSKLFASEQQFRKLVQTQSAIVWRADPATLRFLFVSDEAESLLGYPVGLWLNDPDFFREHIHRDDYERASAFSAAEIEKLNSHEVEFRIFAADGRCVWLRNFTDLSIKNGRVVELYGFMIDVTKQRQTEEQLRLAATTFESQQGIMITDADARILRVNRAFTEITGYSQEQIAGKNPNILKSGLHDKSFYRKLWKQLLTDGRFEGEVWNRRSNGEIYPQWQTITAVKNDAGETSHYVAMFSDITEKKNAENKIHALAYYDPLTSLPNRRLLLDRFEQQLIIARRHNKFGAVIFLDLDHFKALNDTQGHLVGDELLVQVADRLSSVLRKEDTPARLGGDEFVVLLHAESDSPSIAADHTRIVAEKIREKLNEPFLLNNYLHRLSPSIGIALFPDHQASPDKILQQADIAMYRSKTGGRNTISFFHPEMQHATEVRLKLEQHLRTTIEQGGFVLYYQPQINEKGEVFGTEALIRWNYPDRGLLPPKDFIPVAEESSIILDIGSWVLHESCRQIKAWQDAGVTPPQVSVNISAHQFRQKNFVDQVREAIDNAGIAADLLGIELTESLMIDDIEETIAKMQALKAMGVAIAVDDFGTGYSSLMYLKQLPIDVLKIDRGFVKDVQDNGSDAVIIETIISMAHHLNLQVIAEGVETHRQLDFLKQRGCHAFQGFYFSQPLSAEQYAEHYLPPVPV